MFDEDELQRKELERLLGTAKDEERKEFIRKAIAALSTGDEMSDLDTAGSDRFYINSLNPAVQASLLNTMNVPLEGMAPFVRSSSNPALLTSTSSRLRPMSARRRPSTKNLLDAIPENHSVISKGSSLIVDRNTEIVLPSEDISDVTASSYDLRYPPNSIFKVSGVGVDMVHRKDRSFWVSTGLTPQFITASFYDKWIIRKIEIKCYGVDSISIQLLLSASSKPVKLLQTTRIREGEFEFDAATHSLEHISGDDPFDRGGIVAKGISLFVQKSNDPFFCVNEVLIRCKAFNH